MNLKNRIILETNMKLVKSGVEVNPLLLHSILDDVLSRYEITKIAHEDTGASIEEVLQFFLSCKKTEGVKQTTINNYKYKIVAFKDFVTKEKISDISINDLRSFVAFKQQRSKPSTLNNIIEIIKLFFDWSFDEKYITDNPALRLKNIKRNRKLRKPLTITQIEKVRSACVTTRERCMVECLLATGIRVSEMIEIKISDIIDNRIVINGKGEKERYIFFNEKSMYYMQEYLQNRLGKNEYLFASLNTPYGRLSVAGIQRAIKKIGKRCGINIYPHKFRHTMATELMQHGCDISTISTLLGHSQIATTSGYIEVDTKRIQNEHYIHATI